MSWSFKEANGWIGIKKDVFALAESIMDIDSLPRLSGYTAGARSSGTFGGNGVDGHIGYLPVADGFHFEVIRCRT